MSEIPQSIPDTAIQDKDLAWDMAHAQKPYWEAEKRMNDAGETETADKLAIQGLAVVTELEGARTASTNEQNPVNSQEKDPDKHEQIIKSAMQESIAVFDMWFRGNDVPREHRSGQRNTITNVFTDPVLTAPIENAYGAWVGFMPKGKDGRIHRDLEKRFDEKGISEAVFVSDALPKTFGQFSPESPYKDDSIVVVRYQTLAERDGKYSYLGGGRPGNHLRAQIVLPKTIADQLAQEVEQNPATIREVLTGIMEERIGAGEDWKASRPPYESWEDVNDGTNRMLLYKGDIKQIEDGRVLEWRG